MKLLIFHTGSLGDTLIAIPSLKSIRNYFPNCELTLFTNYSDNGKVQIRDILADTNYIDNYFYFHAKTKHWQRALSLWYYLVMIIKLRLRKYSKLIYLLKNEGNSRKLKRDKLFFKLVGIKEIIGMPELDSRRETVSILEKHLSDQLLERLFQSGISNALSYKGDFDLKLNQNDLAEFDKWQKSLNLDYQKRWVAVGIGANIPVNRWPIQRYDSVIKKLIDKYKIWPIIFGGRNEQSPGMNLVKKWGCGSVAAGILSIRAGIVALSHCSFYLGNNTGTMHMAVTAGIRCLAIFSSRDYPDHWNPYGVGHNVLRTSIDCEACMLERCVERKMQCILSISEYDVIAAAEDFLFK